MLIEYTYGSKGDKLTKPANSEYHNNENDDYFINICYVMLGVLICVIITTIIFTILV